MRKWFLIRRIFFINKKLLYALGKVGELNQNRELHINAADFRRIYKELQITGINGCLEILGNYGFVFDGLVNEKVI